MQTPAILVEWLVLSSRRLPSIFIICQNCFFQFLLSTDHLNTCTILIAWECCWVALLLEDQLFIVSCSISHRYLGWRILLASLVFWNHPLGQELNEVTMNGMHAPFPGPGAAVWQEHRTPDNRTYYYNVTTKQTQWTKPEEMMTGAEVSLASGRRSYLKTDAN